MTQGLYVDGRRPKSKKEVAELVKAGELGRVHVEATSWFGGEYDGPLDDWTGGKDIIFVGPDPYTKRNFYGAITMKSGKVTVK